MTIVAIMKSISSRSLFIFITYFTCCVWAWPAASPSIYRKAPNFDANVNYLPYPYSANVVYEPELDYQLPQQQDAYAYNGHWDRAKEPEGYYDVLDEVDWMNQPVSENEVEGLSDLAELYEPPAVWGQIVKGRPETELEELKAEERRKEAEERQRALQDQYNYYDYSGRQQKRGSNNAAIVATSQDATTPKPKVATISTPKASIITTALPTKSDQPPQKSGQKEVPLLRPPSKAKVSGGVKEEHEPVIEVAQRSVAEKPSAYDTLRKYLSLEDALKKEAENEIIFIKRDGNWFPRTKDSSLLLAKREFLKKEIQHLLPLSQSQWYSGSNY